MRVVSKYKTPVSIPVLKPKPVKKFELNENAKAGVILLSIVVGAFSFLFFACKLIEQQ